MLNFFLLILKITIVYIIILNIRGMLPRYRINDLHVLYWKYLIPYTVSIFFLNICIFYLFFK